MNERKNARRERANRPICVDLFAGSGMVLVGLVMMWVSGYLFGKYMVMMWVSGYLFGKYMR